MIDISTEEGKMLVIAITWLRGLNPNLTQDVIVQKLRDFSSLTFAHENDDQAEAVT